MENNEVLKWFIDLKGLAHYKISNLGNIYKDPYNANGKNYSRRCIKIQYGNRWKLVNTETGLYEWWNKSVLRDHLQPLDEEIDLNPNNIPF